MELEGSWLKTAQPISLLEQSFLSPALHNLCLGCWDTVKTQADRTCAAWWGGKQSLWWSKATQKCLKNVVGNRQIWKVGKHRSDRGNDVYKSVEARETEALQGVWAGCKHWKEMAVKRQARGGRALDTQVMKPPTRPGFPSFLLHHLPLPTTCERKTPFPLGLSSTKILSKLVLNSFVGSQTRDHSLLRICFCWPLWFLENELCVHEPDGPLCRVDGRLSQELALRGQVTLTDSTYTALGGDSK